MGIPNYLTCLLRNLFASQEATVKTDMEEWTSSKLGNEYVKTVCCYPVYLTSMQSMSCEVLDWMKLTLESKLWEKILIT